MTTVNPKRVVIVITDTNVETKAVDVAFDIEGGIEPSETPSAAVVLGRLLMDQVKEACIPKRTLN